MIKDFNHGIIMIQNIVLTLLGASIISGIVLFCLFYICLKKYHFKISSFLLGILFFIAVGAFVFFALNPLLEAFFHYIRQVQQAKTITVLALGMLIIQAVLFLAPPTRFQKANGYSKALGFSILPLFALFVTNISILLIIGASVISGPISFDEVLYAIKTKPFGYFSVFSPIIIYITSVIQACSFAILQFSVARLFCSFATSGKIIKLIVISAENFVFITILLFPSYWWLENLSLAAGAQLSFAIIFAFLNVFLSKIKISFKKGK